MTDYTPTEYEISAAYVRDDATIVVRGNTLTNEAIRKSDAEVKRGIAKIKADARDEAIDFISRHYEDYLPPGWDKHADDSNPYRESE